MPKPVPTLEWLHICDYAFRDERGKLCLIGMFDALHSVRRPGRLPVFCVAIGLTDGQGRYETALELVAPSGKVVEFPLPPVVLQQRQAKARAVIQLTSLPFEEFGRYTFRLKVDGAPIDYPVHHVDHLQLQAAQGGSTAPPPPPDFPPPQG